VLGLFEGVVSGAADGYARMADKPAVTLLHLGPGLANGLANFHNAMRAHVPVVSIVGDHATYHRDYDSPLTSDIVGYAQPVSGWIRENRDPLSLPEDTRDAVIASRQAGGQVATLIVPADCTWSESTVPAEKPAAWPEPEKVDAGAVASAATALRSGEPVVMLMSGQALREAGLWQAGRIAAHSGARLMCDTLNTRLTRGAGRVPVERLPYFPELAVQSLSGVKHLIIVGTRPPVGFFAYPDKPSWLTPEGCAIHILAQPQQDAIEALERLSEEIGAGSTEPALQPLAVPALPAGEFNSQSMGSAIGALIPEGTIVAEEAATCGLPLFPFTAGANPHEWLTLTGGAIGQGLPLAVGAAIACPDRKVLCLEADGSGMYTLQAFWTMAREQLNVTTVIYANRCYRILQLEHERVGAGKPGPRANAMMDLRNPDLDWVKMARGMGVPAKCVTTLEDFNATLSAFMNEPGPNLIEAVVGG